MVDDGLTDKNNHASHIARNASLEFTKTLRPYRTGCRFGVEKDNPLLPPENIFY
jgi:hypothetical protein